MIIIRRMRTGKAGIHERDRAHQMVGPKTNKIGRSCQGRHHASAGATAHRQDRRACGTHVSGVGPSLAFLAPALSTIGRRRLGALTVTRVFGFAD